MAQLLIAAVGSAIGGAIFPAGIVAFGMTGEAIGWAAGSLVGSLFTPTQKSAGPRLDDMTVMSASYGTPIPWIQGHPRIAPIIIWGQRHEITTVTEQGKGGGAEYTNYTYTADLLLLLSAEVIGGVSRVWINGELVWTALASSGESSINASAQTTRWTRMTVYTGDVAQLPDPTYEAAVGVGNVPAYRGRGTMFIEGLNLGGSGALPNITVEVYMEGVAAPLPLNDFVLRYSAADWRDVSTLARTVSDYDDPVTGYTIIEDTSNTLFGLTTAKMSSEMTGRATYTTGHGTRFEVSALSIESGDWTIETFFYLDSTKDYGGGWLFNHGGAGYAFSTPGDPDLEYTRGGYSCWITPAGAIRFFLGSSLSSGYHQEIAAAGAGLGTWTHLAIVKLGETISIYCAGDRQASATQEIPISLSGSAGLFIGNMWSQSHPVIVTTGSFIGNLVEFRISVGTARYSGAACEVPIEPFGTEDAITLTDGTIADTVTAICTRAGMSAGDFDVAGLSGITLPMRAMSITQVSTARAVLDMLAGPYFFDSYLRDKVYFVARGGAAAAALAYSDIGWSVDATSDSDPLPIAHANELEVPAQIAISYQAVDADYQVDTQYSDRLLSGQTSTSVMQLPIALTASEAKAIADRSLFDQAWQYSTDISVSTAHTRLENTDVITVTGDDASVYRLRVVSRSDTGGVSKLSCVFDDASVATQAGTTEGLAQTQTTVAAPATPTLVVLDIPILRDADDRPGLYVAVGGVFTTARLFESLDDSAYVQIGTITEPAVMGRCTTTLGSYTGFNTFDEVSTLTVNVGAGTLASATYEQIYTSNLINAALVGSEVIQFRTATLVSTGVYTLSGLLRGLRGTGWARTTHAAYEQFVLLDTPGMRFVPLDSSELGKTRYFRAVGAGQRPIDGTTQEVAPLGVGLEPFAGTGLTADRTTTDTVLSWRRGTRLSTRLVGPLAISAPLSDSPESYEVEIYEATYTTLKRTLTSSTTSVTYTAAQQTTDFGSGQTVLYVRIYQLSDTVGRGYVYQAST